VFAFSFVIMDVPPIPIVEATAADSPLSPRSTSPRSPLSPGRTTNIRERFSNLTKNRDNDPSQGEGRPQDHTRTVSNEFDHMSGSVYNPDEICPFCDCPRSSTIFCPATKLSHANGAPMKKMGVFARLFNSDQLSKGGDSAQTPPKSVTPPLNEGHTENDSMSRSRGLSLCSADSGEHSERKKQLEKPSDRPKDDVGFHFFKTKEEKKLEKERADLYLEQKGLRKAMQADEEEKRKSLDGEFKACEKRFIKAKKDFEKAYDTMNADRKKAREKVVDEEKRNIQELQKIERKDYESIKKAEKASKK
jgi:hypothetical protein